MTDLPDSGTRIVCLTKPDPDLDRVETIQQVAANTTPSYQLEHYTVADDDPEFSPQDTALGVALGGDGTFLEGVRRFAPHGIPMLAINTGTLGFLARVHPDNLADAVTAACTGNVEVIDREMLAATGAGMDAVGINEVAVEPLPPEHPTDRKVATIHAYIDDEYVGEFTGSGLAVATPTGSTALSLSAGGPIHFPNANSSLQLTPKLTHNVGVRPVIADNESTITIIPEHEVKATVDGGRSHTRVSPGTELTVTGADKPAKIVRTDYDETFFDALSGELGWGLRDVDEPGPR